MTRLRWTFCMQKLAWKTALTGERISRKSCYAPFCRNLRCYLFIYLFSKWRRFQGCRWLQTDWWSTLCLLGWWWRSGTGWSCTAQWSTLFSERTTQVGHVSDKQEQHLLLKTTLRTRSDNAGSFAPRILFTDVTFIIFWLVLAQPWRQSCWSDNYSRKSVNMRHEGTGSVFIHSSVYMRRAVFSKYCDNGFIHFWPWIKSSLSSQICTELTNSTAWASGRVTTLCLTASTWMQIPPPNVSKCNGLDCHVTSVRCRTLWIRLCLFSVDLLFLCFCSWRHRQAGGQRKRGFWRQEHIKGGMKLPCFWAKKHANQVDCQDCLHSPYILHLIKKKHFYLAFLIFNFNLAMW